MWIPAFMWHLAMCHVQSLWHEGGQEADTQVMVLVAAGFAVNAADDVVSGLHDYTEYSSV
jgi:hypothetical protein